MSQRNSSREAIWGAVLAIAIGLGIGVAWTPRFWSIAVLHSTILLTGITWFWKYSRLLFPDVGIAVAWLSCWGWIQLLCGWTIAPFVTLPGAIVWTVAGFAFFLSVQILRSQTTRDLFLSVLVSSAAIFSMLAVLQLYTSPDEVLWLFPAQARSVGTFLYKNQFAAMLELSAPIALYWMFFRESHRWAGAALFASLFGGAIVSASRAGTILIVLEFCLILLLAYLKGKVPLKLLLLLIPAVICGCVGVALLFGSEQIVEHFREPHPYIIRQELLKSTVPIIGMHPLAGSGLNTWSLVYPRFATFDIGLFANAAHNDWAEWSAEGGLPFSALLFTLVVLLAGPAIRSIWGVGILAVMLHSWVDYPTREPVILVMWFCLAGAVVVNARSGGKRQRSRSGKRALRLRETLPSTQ